MAVMAAPKIISVVGMPGSGKSEVARICENSGFTRVRFGDITDQGVAARGLPLSEPNERLVREALRREHGMTAYALLNIPRIDAALEKGDVVIDGLYSWEEYLLLKQQYGASFHLVAVWASPRTRYARLARRKHRPLKPEEAAGRDKAEIEQVGKGGPIAVADFTIINEASPRALKNAVKKVLENLP